MSVESGRKYRVFVENADQSGRGCGAAVPVHRVYRSVPEKESVGEPLIFRVCQPLVQPGDLRRGHQRYVSRHVEADKPGISIVERVCQVIG